MTCIVDRTPSREGYRVFLTLVDTFTGYLFAMPLTGRTEADVTTALSIAWTPTFFGTAPRRLHFDGEPAVERSRIVQHFFHSRGVRVTFSNAGKSCQNATAERANRTIQTVARSLLTHARLPFCFWSDAVLHAVEILNRRRGPPHCPQSPAEKQHGVPPRGRLYVFGATA